MDTEMHTGRTPWEHEGRDWSDMSTRQGTTKIASKPPEFKLKGWNRVFFFFFSSQASEKQHCWNLDPGLLVYRIVR